MELREKLNQQLFFIAYNFSNQSMKKNQNSNPHKLRLSNVQVSHPEESDAESTTTKKEKSAPKFNRKTQIKILSRKKSDVNLAANQPMCYISPKRSSKPSIDLFKSPNFQDIAQKFSASLFESSVSSLPKVFSPDTLAQSQIFEERSNYREERQELEARYRIEIDGLRLEVKKLEEQNKIIRHKLSEMQGLQCFLVQRQAYIYQLTSSNLVLNEQISVLKNQKQSVQAELLQLRKQLQTKTKECDSQYKKLMTKFEAQQVEMNMLIKKSSKTKEELKVSKAPKINQKQSNISRKFKENNENFNRKRQRSFVKSKSAILPIVPPQVINNKVQISLDISQIEKTQSIPGDSQTVIDLCESIKENSQSLSKIKSSISSDQPLLNEDLNLPSSFDRERADCHQAIKQLRQKLRYSEIEIDVLRKVKLDNDKMKDENNKLKGQNRKLLNRIDFMTRQSNRKRCYCDQSFELSLSPNKH